MASSAERAALLVLLGTGTRSSRDYAEAVEDAGSALAVLEAERASRPTLFAEAELAAAETEIMAWEREGIHVLTVLDADYPDTLRAVHDRPPLIFTRGALRPEDARAVAVIGARRVSSAGRAAAATVARHLVDRRFTVTSGLAAGVDTAAHTAALAQGGRTVAVIGTGLRRCYPPENADLQRQIARRCAVVSPFWPATAPSRRTFPLRNALMSGLSLGTVVVEASPTSGARLQARLALAQGRPVFLLHTLLAQLWARAFAERPGTYVVRRVAEITRVIERLALTDSLAG